MRVAVYGAGGVGGYFGGRLAQAGHAVAFVARGEHLAAIRRDGLAVASVAGDFVVRPAEAVEDPADIGPVDLVLVGVKAWQVTETAKALSPLLRPDTVVLPLQNGVEAADQLSAVIGPERVLGGLCKIMSLVAGPGKIRHAAVEPRIEFGERDRRKTPRVAALREVFERCQGVSVDTPDDIEAALWEKFLFIAPVSGVGAVTRMPVGVVRRVPETRALLAAAMDEVEAVARARGIGVRADIVARTLGYIDGLPETTTASMQRDIMEGRPSELEQQNGAMARLGRQLGVPVPVHECLYRSLLPAELKARGQL